MSLDEVMRAARRVMSEWRRSPFVLPQGAPPPAIRGRLPPSYLEFLRQIGPGEGFIGESYVRIFPLDELAAFNASYEVAEYLPGHVIFGSDGCGNAYLFDLRRPKPCVVRCAFIPLDPEYAELAADDFETFLRELAAVSVDFTGPYVPNPETLGLEVHEIHPIVLGGDPSNPENKTLLEPTTHAEACRTFNRLFRKLRAAAAPR